MNVMRKVLRRLRGNAKGSEILGEVPAGWYDDIYKTSKTYGTHYSQSRYYPMWAVIADRLRQAKVNRVLEVGCGSGQLAALLAYLGVRHEGFAISPVAVEMARQACPSGTFRVGNALNAESFRGSFDALICTEVLEHIEEDLRVVDNFPPGVRCICSVPNFPFRSHVRHFLSASEVAERYAPYFDGFDVSPWISPHKMSAILWLFDGVRNDVHP